MKKKLFLLTFLFFASITHAQDSAIKQYIVENSVDGKLDFHKTLEKEKNKLFLYKDTAYAKNEFAILLWAKSVKKLGLSSRKKAMVLWEQIYKRALKKHEKKAFKKGFKD